MGIARKIRFDSLVGELSEKMFRCSQFSENSVCPEFHSLTFSLTVEGSEERTSLYTKMHQNSLIINFLPNFPPSEQFVVRFCEPRNV